MGRVTSGCQAWHSRGVLISVVEETGSTQDDVVAALQRDGSAWPHLSGLRAKVQSSGRGRTGRQWETGGVRALTVSFVLRPSAPVSEWGTIALRAGVAVVRALAGRGINVRLKWPNDVVIATNADVPGWHGIAKVGGILGSVVQDSAGEYVCVLGIGLNLSGDAGLPFAATLDTDLDAGALAVDIQRELATLVAAEGEFAPLGELLAEHCHTLGKAVVVTFPHTDPPGEVSGRAVRIDHDGALVVSTNGQEVRILNGDLAHTRLRPEIEL